MVFVFHCLVYFTQHNALQFHPCCHKGQELLPSFCCVVLFWALLPCLSTTYYNVNSLYILEIKPLPDVSLANMFSHVVNFLFILMMYSSAMQKLFNFIQSNLFIFPLLPLPQEIYQQQYCYRGCLKFYCLFYSRTFMVSQLLSKSFIHFSLFWCMV